MEEIKEFSKEVCQELKYYVYRLVDPRDGQTFYVGKGKNNRVFAHAKCELANFNGESYLDKDETDKDESLKYKTIREIKDAGLDIIYIIQRYGLDERDALIIESTLIDVFSLEKLTNDISGFDSDKGPINAITLERDIAVKEYVDSIANPKYIIIKVKDYWLNQRNQNRYETTRSSWKVNIDKARKYPYVLSVTNGIVREVYKVREWHECPWGRNEFTGTIAEDKVRNLFKDKRIPQKYRKKGSASPFQMCRPGE